MSDCALYPVDAQQIALILSLKHSYTFLAPVYDAIVSKATAPMRLASLARLDDVLGKEVLICGVGTGLDLPHLPHGARYTGIDLTPAMLKRAESRIGPQHNLKLDVGDVMQLPYADAQFDTVIMHLILAVVPSPLQALREAARVTKPGGKIHILDKFLRRGQLAPMRRLMNVLLRHIATRTDVVFEELLDGTPQLRLLVDEHCIPGGWFRTIVVQKSA